MSRRALILAVVVLLIVSSVAVLVTSPARASPAVTSPAAATFAKAQPHPSVSTIEFETTPGAEPNYNASSPQFYSTGPYPGPDYQGYNILYFAIYDPVDTQATFKITDPNATRDGLPNPVFSATVPINNTTHLYFSYEHSLDYVFPADLKVGGGWNVSVSGALGGNASYPIFVGTYYLNIYGSPETYSAVLPGEAITASYQALSFVNGGPVTTITNVSYNGYYYGANDTYTWLFPTGTVKGTVASFGSTTFTVPANATPNTYIQLNVWVSIYQGNQMAENESYSVEWYVGQVYIDRFTLATDSGTCYSDYGSDEFENGSYVQGCALIGALAYDEFTPVPGLSVSIHYWNGAMNVTPAGGPSSLTSNATGWVSFGFWASNTQFSTYYQAPGYNSVNLSASDTLAMPVPKTTDFTYTWIYTFYVEQSVNWAGVTVQFNQLSYYPGQAITASWAIAPTNPSVGTVTASYWSLWSNDDALLAQGTISSTASSGTIPVTLPSGYVGEFEIELWATNATTLFEGDAYAYSTAPALFLNPSSTTFTSGATITVQALAYGDQSVTDPTITYQVWAEFELGETSYGGGGEVSTGTVTNGSSFTINVPSTGEPGYYYIYAVLSGTGGIVATQWTYLYQSWGYNVFVGVSTLSNYADGSYQPGQTVTVTYTISPYGSAPLPTYYQFILLLDGTQVGSVDSTTSTSGSVQLTIPSGWQTGVAIIEVELVGTYLEDQGAPGNFGQVCGGGECEGTTAIVVNAHPSLLNMDVGAGSGLTVGWLILLIIILVVAIVLVLMIRRKRASPPSGGAPTTTPMNPPAPAPSQPAAAQWQEPASSPPPASSDQPPMPTPPPGAT